MNRSPGRSLVLSLFTCLAWSGTARVEDSCREVATARALHTSAATVMYWDGAAGVYLRGDEATRNQGELVVYFQRDKPPAPESLALDRSAKPAAHDEPRDPHCAAGLKTWTVRLGTSQPPSPPDQPPPPLDPDKQLQSIAVQYRSPTWGTRGALRANSATSMASEAAQILGQIVVDRGSEAAYRLLTRKAQKWLKCGSGTRFAATCQVLDSLRLQDLAMAPDLLRASLAQDGLGIVDMLRQKPMRTAAAPHAGKPVLRTVFAASGQAGSDTATASPCDRPAAGSPDDLRCMIKSALEDRIVPTLARPVSALTGHPSELLVRQLVDKGLAEFSVAAGGKLCTLAGRDRILALVGLSFADCENRKDAEGECDIMKVVEQLATTCQTNPLQDHQLAYAQSIAGHLWQAVTAKAGLTGADGQMRLLGAVEGSCEVACMYAVTSAAGPYRCELRADAHGDIPLEPSESVAVARDVMLGAVDRDGTAIAAALIRALGRVLPAADDKDEPRGLRILSTITAYAATYAGKDSTSDDAHRGRSALLESLTRDMTNRTDRGGDTIASIGGSLRVMLGGRIGRTRTNPTTGMEERASAFLGPLSLPLGFGLDALDDSKAHHGFHIELGILDLGQYLTWDAGGKVTTPDLTAAFSPSLTLGYAFGRETPFFIGVTGGYTPSYDFGPDATGDKHGAFNVGVTAGVYVPLFDFN